MSKEKQASLYIILISIVIGIIPILWSNSLLDPNSSIQYIGLTTILLSFFLLSKNKTIELNQKAVFILSTFCIYILYSFIPLFISTNIVDGIFQLSEDILYFSLICVFIQFKSPQKIFKITYRTIIVLSIIILIPAITQLIDLLHNQHLTFPNSTYILKSIFPHRNVFSHFILLIFPFCIYSFLKENGTWKYLGLISSALILFLIIILSNRTTWAALLMTTIAILSTVLIIKKKSTYPYKKRLFLLLGSIAIVFVLASVIMSKHTDISSLKTHVSNSVDSNEGSTKDRLELWKRTWLLIKEKPLLGHGIGSWKINMLQYGNKGLASENNITFYQRPHNDFLWVFAEQGIIGVLLYLSFFVAIVFHVIRAIRTSKNNTYNGQLLVYLSILVSYLVISNLSFPKERICHNIILYSSIGLFLNIINRTSESGQSRILKLSKLKYLFVSILTLIFIIGILRFKGEMHTKNAMSARETGNFQLCISEIDKAKSILYKFDETSTPIVWQSGLSYFRLENYSKANECFEEAKNMNPYHVYVLSDYASCLNKLNRNEEAIENYKEALIISPNFLNARLNLCALYFKQEKYELAFKLLKESELNSSNERLKKSIILVTRKIIDSELNKTQAKNKFLELYNKEYNNYSFYKNILRNSKEHNCSINEMINKPEKINQQNRL